MDKQAKSDSRVRGSFAARVFNWVDDRTGAKSLMKLVLDEPIPGGARFAYVFGSGLLFIFILQVITGVSLALYYTPTAETAHTSVAYITKQVAGGAFLRSLHSYGSSAMIIVLALHFLQTFLYGSFKGRRELLWISGALLSFLVLGMGFTGYLLPWDQKAYFATAVGTNVAGEMPLIGNLLTRLMRGGDTIGTLTLSRFYVAHVFLIPATIFLFIGAHVLLFRKAGPAGQMTEDPISPKLAPETFYPRQVLLDMGFALLTIAVLGGLSYLRPVTLGPLADPSDTHFLPRPEWYYLPMFEWLKFWEGSTVVMGIVVIPALLAMAFFLMPFLDRRLERKPWRRPIPALAVAIVILGMVYLGVKSRIDDKHGSVAAQLALQEQQEAAYSAAAFQPYVESTGGAESVAAPAGPQNPLIAQGKGMFTERGCVGCHGPSGAGTALAPSLVGVTGKFPQQQLIALLHNPNLRMKAGGMPALDASPKDMSALVSYLGALGTRAANVPAIYEAPSQPASAGAGVLGHLSRVSMPIGVTGDTAKSTIKSASTAAGKDVFQERACFACHGEAGAGGRAPALAPVVKKLSDVQLRQVLESPTAKMKAGGMPPLVGTPDQINSLVSYLRILRAPEPAKQPAVESAVQEKHDAPVTPASFIKAAPALPPVVAPSGEIAHIAAVTEHVAGRELFHSQGCIACHGMNAQGTQLAPSLMGVATKFPGQRLAALLHHPTLKMQTGGMPPVSLNDSQFDELVSYLDSLGATPAQNTAVPKSEQATTEPHFAAAQSSRQSSVANQTAEHEKKDVALDPLVLRGKHVFQRNACAACHGIEGLRGTAAAPGLAETASMLPESELEKLLRHHSARMQRGGMPLTDFAPQDIKAIVAYIRSMAPAAEERLAIVHRN